MKNKTQGFTLIELLIVIAIIGILAAVLIPQLLNARVSANKRAVQAHAANVYKALEASLADDNTASLVSIGAIYGNDCKTPAVVSATKKFGWNAAPGTVATAADCLIKTPTATDTDFVVTVKGDASSGNFTSINGN